MDLVAGAFFFAIELICNSEFELRQFLAAGNRRDDADFVAVFERRLAVFQEADVFLVHIDVDEPADFAFFVHEAFLDAGEARLQFLEGGTDGGGVDFDKLLVVGQLAERGGDADFLWHKFNVNSLVRLDSKLYRTAGLIKQ